MPGLVVEPRQHRLVTLVVNAAFQRTPLPHQIFRLCRTFVVRVINVLNYRLSGMQPVSVRHVVKETEAVRRPGTRKASPRLPGTARQSPCRGRAAVHADALMVGAMPLAPAVTLRRLDPRPVVASQNVGQRSCAQRTGVAFVDTPGRKQHCRDGADNGRVVAERKLRPFLGDVARTQIGVPGEAAKPVEIGHGERMAEPVRIHTHIRHAHKSTRGTMEGSTRCEVLNGSAASAGVQVEVQHLFPHRGKKTEMSLLARVFLRDLQFDRLIRAP